MSEPDLVKFECESCEHSERVLHSQAQLPHLCPTCKGEMYRNPNGCPHLWSEWEIGPYFPREERFCSLCGSMETQEIR